MEEAKKENFFLKSSGILRKVNRLGAYRFTVHKYINTELGLKSIVRPQKPEYRLGKPHKVFENKLNQDFHADAVNQKLCTDFTYLFLNDGEVRYNCTIIDLHDRDVAASITDRHITGDLVMRTLQKALGLATCY